MPQTHKLVRDSCEDVLRAGFNQALATALPFYGVTDPIALEWETGTTYARLAAGDFRLSKIEGRLTLEIAPDGSQWTGETRGIQWSGIVGVRLIFRVRYSFRAGDEIPPDDDSVVGIATAIEDATIAVFQAFRGWPDNLIYSRPPDCPEGYALDLLQEGCEVTIPMRVGFKVDALYE